MHFFPHVLRFFPQGVRFCLQRNAKPKNKQAINVSTGFESNLTQFKTILPEIKHG
jgi:hypothetical protein